MSCCSIISLFGCVVICETERPPGIIVAVNSLEGQSVAEGRRALRTVRDLVSSDSPIRPSCKADEPV